MTTDCVSTVGGGEGAAFYLPVSLPSGLVGAHRASLDRDSHHRELCGWLWVAHMVVE